MAGTELTSRLKPIEGARRNWWRLWSIRLNLIGGLLLTAFMTWPEFALTLWNMMPDEVKALVPDRFILAIPLALFALSVIARLIRQEKLIGNGE